MIVACGGASDLLNHSHRWRKGVNFAGNFCYIAFTCSNSLLRKSTAFLKRTYSIIDTTIWY